MSNKYCTLNELPVMLNASDVAVLLGVSRAFAYNLFHAEGFPVIAIGKRRLVQKDSFLNWLKQKENVEV